MRPIILRVGTGAKPFKGGIRRVSSECRLAPGGGVCCYGAMSATTLPREILVLERPHRALWTYYVLCALFTGPGVLVTLPYLYFRYHTLRYRFDDDGIHMQVGILFR